MCEAKPSFGGDDGAKRGASTVLFVRKFPFNSEPLARYFGDSARHIRGVFNELFGVCGPCAYEGFRGCFGDKSTCFFSIADSADTICDAGKERVVCTGAALLCELEVCKGVLIVLAKDRATHGGASADLKGHGVMEFILKVREPFNELFMCQVSDLAIGSDTPCEDLNEARLCEANFLHAGGVLEDRREFMSIGAHSLEDGLKDQVSDELDISPAFFVLASSPLAGSRHAGDDECFTVFIPVEVFAFEAAHADVFFAHGEECAREVLQRDDGLLGGELLPEDLIAGAEVLCSGRKE